MKKQAHVDGLTCARQNIAIRHERETAATSEVVEKEDEFPAIGQGTTTTPCRAKMSRFRRSSQKLRREGATHVLEAAQIDEPSEENDEILQHKTVMDKVAGAQIERPLKSEDSHQICFDAFQWNTPGRVRMDMAPDIYDVDDYGRLISWKKLSAPPPPSSGRFRRPVRKRATRFRGSGCGCGDAACNSEDPVHEPPGVSCVDLPPATDDGRQWDGTNQDATRHTHESKRPSGEKNVGNIEVAAVADVLDTECSQRMCLDLDC